MIKQEENKVLHHLLLVFIGLALLLRLTGPCSAEKR
jgi:hypothetical protein